MTQPTFLRRDEWRNLREDSSKKPVFQKVKFPASPEQSTFWLENRNTPEGVSINTKHSVDVEYQFEFHSDHGFTSKDFVNLGGNFIERFHKPVVVGITSGRIPMGKCYYPYVQLQWHRKYYLVDHYIGGVQDKNPARLNAMGETDATHDGSWEVWADVDTGGTSVGLSRLYDIKDIDDVNLEVVSY